MAPHQSATHRHRRGFCPQVREGDWTRKYMRAVMSELPKRNGWPVAEHVGDRTPDKSQRLLNRACWDEAKAMARIRRFAVSGLQEAARKTGRRRGRLVIGALDETGQQKNG